MTLPNTKPVQPNSGAGEDIMRTWIRGLECRDRSETDSGTVRLSKNIHPYVTVSREASALGTAVARQVANRLGWQMVDKILLDSLVEQFKSPRDLVRFIDETTSNPIFAAFDESLEQRLPSKSETIGQLGRFALLAAHHTSSVFVGRGFQFLLPRESGLRVRIVTPRDQRINFSAQVRQLGLEEAEQHVLEVDGERRDFVQDNYFQNVDDATLYDLVVNLEQLDVDAAADLIVSQCQRRFHLDQESVPTV